jgi:heme/copper-type cytochrome/quinol oxidase subunit 3
MIPYTTERRADTGASNVTLGIWLFLASEVMLFGALFSSYALLRVAAPDWPSGRDALDLWSGVRNTAILLLSTAFIWRAQSASSGTARPALLVGIAGALLFLVSKGWEWRPEIAAGLLPSTSTFWAMYYTLTGLHALHVAGGLIANVWVLADARRVGEAMTAGRIRALALYWGFVDVVWLIIFGVMYLS